MCFIFRNNRERGCAQRALCGQRDRPCQVSVDDQEITVPRAPARRPPRFFVGALSRVQNPITIDPNERFGRATEERAAGFARLLGPRDT